MARPTPKELNRKLEDAKAAIKNKHVRYVNWKVTASELEELDVYGQDEILMAIQHCLGEIKASDYAGKRPPEESYQPVIKGEELFAFAWNSSHFGQKMYLKFCLVGGYFYHVSLHEAKY